MARGVVTIGLGASIEDAARLMMEEEVTHLPVISEDRLGGEAGGDVGHEAGVNSP